MNTNQKFLTMVALVAFIISIYNASWEKVSFLGFDGTVYKKETVYSPLWHQPYTENPLGSKAEECHLLWSPLVGIWIAIGVIFVGLYFLLKNTPSILVLLNSPSKKNDTK